MQAERPNAKVAITHSAIRVIIAFPGAVDLLDDRRTAKTSHHFSRRIQQLVSNNLSLRPEKAVPFAFWIWPTRDPEHRELLLSGLRLATGETALNHG